MNTAETELSEDERQVRMRRVAKELIEHLNVLRKREGLDADAAFGALLSTPAVVAAAMGANPLEVIAAFVDFIQQSVEMTTVQVGGQRAVQA